MPADTPPAHIVVRPETNVWGCLCGSPVEVIPKWGVRCRAQGYTRIAGADDRLTGDKYRWIPWYDGAVRPDWDPTNEALIADWRKAVAEYEASNKSSDPFQGL